MRLHNGDTDPGSELLGRLLAGRGGQPEPGSPLMHVATLPARQAVHAGWPDWVPGALREAVRRAGVERLWVHQARAAQLARHGQHVVVATGTASGKSLGYQLPVLARLLEDRRATALYLSPTKALGADQLATVQGFELDGIRPAAYDGDTPYEQRDWVRAHSRWVFTNPDMLHHGILPRHGRWAGFLRRCAYIVVDECHAYRGVFGSHVALLLRRLRRLAARYGAAPTVICASATAADPAASASRLTGVDCAAVTEDGSPRGPRTVGLWQPPLLDEITGENGSPVRRSAGAEAARLLADLVLAQARSLVFVRSRHGAELTALGAQRALSEVDERVDGPASRVAAYRAGYLPEERRALEAALDSGQLLGVAATNALELGVDIAGLDAVVLAGYPGTRASFWQQAGRAGRAGRGALVVFVARDDPLDSYLVQHGDALLGAPVEATVLDPSNPYVLAPQLACAAAELPLTRGCAAQLAGDAARPVLDELVADGTLRQRSGGWFPAAPRPAPHGEVDIRGTGGYQVALVEETTGRMLGTVDATAACSTAHPGAVYLHRGESFVVDELDLDTGIALVHAADPEWSTSARSSTEIAVVSAQRQHRAGAVTVAFGEVEVTAQVTEYLRRLPSGQVLDTAPLELPARTLRTRAVWYSITEASLAEAGLEAARVPGSLHAAEHAAIGLLPLVATCDRWDIGGVSTGAHPDTDAPTVFVHDGHPGGAGFAERAYEAFVTWLTATRGAVAACECADGCPSCVQSPKCGNGNDPLDKQGAVAMLDVVLAAVSDAPAVGRRRREPPRSPRPGAAAASRTGSA